MKIEKARVYLPKDDTLARLNLKQDEMIDAINEQAELIGDLFDALAEHNGRIAKLENRIDLVEEVDRPSWSDVEILKDKVARLEDGEMNHLNWHEMLDYTPHETQLERETEADKQPAEHTPIPDHRIKEDCSIPVEDVQELKPCPFCGAIGESTKTLMVNDGSERWYVVCLGCEACGALEVTDAEAIEAWNRRAGEVK
jgi:Lar family restriction alleviation protein